MAAAAQGWMRRGVGGLLHWREKGLCLGFNFCRCTRCIVFKKRNEDETLFNPYLTISPGMPLHEPPKADELADPFALLRLRGELWPHAFRRITDIPDRPKAIPVSSRLLPRRPPIQLCIPGCTCRRLTGMWWKNGGLETHLEWRRHSKQRLARAHFTRC
jgi:hypothetical protein